MKSTITATIANRIATGTKPSRSITGGGESKLNMPYVKARCKELGFDPTDELIRLAKSGEFLDGDNHRLHVDVVKTLLEYSEEKPKQKTESTINQNLTLAEILVNVGNASSETRQLDSESNPVLEGESRPVCD